MSAIEKNTNQVFRKKYFIDAQEVLATSKSSKKTRQKTYSTIIERSKVAFSDKPILLSPELKKINDHITVNVIREENRIKRIRIACPCGRTADLDCQYSSEG